MSFIQSPLSKGQAVKMGFKPTLLQLPDYRLILTTSRILLFLISPELFFAIHSSSMVGVSEPNTQCLKQVTDHMLDNLSLHSNSQKNSCFNQFILVSLRPVACRGGFYARAAPPPLQENVKCHFQSICLKR